MTDTRRATCPVCSSRDAVTERIHEYKYLESGLDGIILVDSVERTTCSNCGGCFIFVPSEQQLLQLIAVDLLDKRVRLTGPEWKYIRKMAGLTQKDAADAIRCSRRETIAEREGKKSPCNVAEDLLMRIAYTQALIAFLAEERGAYNFLPEKGRERLKNMTCLFPELLQEISLKSQRKPLRKRLARGGSRNWIPASVAA